MMGKSYNNFETLKKILIHVLLIIISITMIMPFFFMISTSFKSTDEVFHIPYKWIPQKIMWENYVYMWQNAPWIRYFINTSVITITVIIGQIFISSLAAYSFARLHFKGRDVIFFIYLGTMMIPFQVIMIPTFSIVKKLGWINELKSVIIPAFFSPFATFLLRQFFLGIPKELEEAAKIDGCGYPRIYWEIMMKNSKPALTTIIIFTFMGTWNDFIRPLIFLNKSETWTLALGLAKFQGTYTTQWNQMMAGSLITMIPVLVVFILGQQYFIQGIVMSGMKE